MKINSHFQTTLFKTVTCAGNGCFVNKQLGFLIPMKSVVSSFVCQFDSVTYKHLRRTCVYQGVRNVCSSKNLACFAFLLPPF